MPHTRLHRIESLVRELSIQDDPERMIRAFTRHADILVRRDVLVTVTRRELQPPWYRITRSSLWQAPINPWTEAERLPLHDQGILGDMLYAGKPALVHRLQVSEDDPAFDLLRGMHSLAAAPSYEHGKVTNLVVLLRREPDSFTIDELETLLLYANLLGRAANNMILSHQLYDLNRALDHEKEQVGRMQRHMLPAELPRIEGLELGASYFACSRAGGDYYDVLPLPEEQWGLFIADVSGHGTPAAVVMAMIHTLLHSFPGPPMPPLRVLAHVNRHLLAMAPEGMFATACYGIYDPYLRRFRFASAGHPLPRLRTAAGKMRDIEHAVGLPLGISEEDTWSERDVVLAPGDVLLLYTDGIVEGVNHAGEPFGIPRLDDVLSLAPLRAGPLVRHIELHYKDFCDSALDQDDRTLLAAVAVP